MQAWNSTETAFFTTQGATGSGWVDNTLTLNFGPVAGYQTTDASSTTGRISNLLPSNVIGMHFNISTTLLGLHPHHGTVDIEGTGLPLNPNEYVLERFYTTARTDHAITDWAIDLIRQPFDPRIITIDTPETVNGDTTAVDVYFLDSLMNSPAKLVLFYADGSGTSSADRMAGTMIFSNVSWIVCAVDCPASPFPGDASPVPEPATIALLAIGLAGIGLSRRRVPNGPGSN